jgi:DNA-binding transcriptional MerR regulator
MPTEYSITELANIADVTTRTIRYYIAQGLLPAPVQQGPNTRYTSHHLDRLRLIKKLQAAHLPLAEIRKQLGSVRDVDVTSAGDTVAQPEGATGSALDYIDTLLRPSASMPAVSERVFMHRVIAPVDAPPRLAASTPPAVPQPSSKPAEPDRAQWERITLDPDIELHVRRPLTRQHNKRVERLISIARQLLEED